MNFCPLLSSLTPTSSFTTRLDLLDLTEPETDLMSSSNIA
eukprot:CAMPEP_0177734540 /NCGR_PEP_ID=MMETSP0484_2-20121128/24287_1 /TAXON_ID=354590 /ORGANISM="Rhodomonas lens, Strain RHODO" /LENGTH=39 /DNA_ID= /DNA_START= /DNA_END= /DNA_ORIENTATION=